MLIPIMDLSQFAGDRKLYFALYCFLLLCVCINVGRGDGTCQAGSSDCSTDGDENHFATDHLRLIIVGATGTGKSALGNSILGYAQHLAGTIWTQIWRPFKSMGSSKSVTVTCQKETAVIRGQKVSIVDTPGFFDTDLGLDQTLSEVAESILQVNPGPHAILLVMRIGRSTDEVVEGVELIKKIFGPESTKFMIVVFTGMDSLESDGMSIEEYVGTMDGPPRKLLEECRMRYIAVNMLVKSFTDKNEKQIDQILDMVNKVVRDNNGRCYTSYLFTQATRLIEEEKRKIEDEKRRVEEEDRLKKERTEKYYLEKEVQAQKFQLEVHEMTIKIMKQELENMRNSIQSQQSRGRGRKKCFDSKSIVKVQADNGFFTEKSLEELVVGDRVQSYNPVTNSVTYSPVYFITYRDDNDQISTLRKLSYRDSDGKEHSLRLQAKHLVYATINVDSMPEKPPSTPVMSENVTIGDILWVVDERGELLPRRVEKIGEIVTTVRHPMTMSHTIIVDGVLASVHMHNEWVLRQATAPLRLLYTISPRLSDSWLPKKAVKSWDYVEKYFLE